MHLMNIDEKLYANSFGLAEQFSLNNGRRFPLTKVVKLCSEVINGISQFSNIEKNINDSTCT